MPAQKELTVGENQGHRILWPSPSKTRGGVEIRDDLENARAQAIWEANRYNQYRYVIQIEEGYVVLGYTSIRDYFDDPMTDEIVFRIEPN